MDGWTSGLPRWHAKRLYWYAHYIEPVYSRGGILRCSSKLSHDPYGLRQIAIDLLKFPIGLATQFPANLRVTIATSRKEVTNGEKPDIGLKETQEHILGDPYAKCITYLGTIHTPPRFGFGLAKGNAHGPRYSQ